jgi:TonB family protein
MIIRSLIAVVCFSFVNAAIAQKQDTISFFYKNSGRQVDVVDSADFFRMVLSPDSTSGSLYRVMDFYVNGTVKQLAYSTNKYGYTFDGAVAEYYPSGQRQSVINYLRGFKIGSEYQFFKNGLLHTHVINNPDTTITLLECRDSTGKVLAVDGNGKWLVQGSKSIIGNRNWIIDNSDYVSMEGSVSNGLREGEWVISFTKSDKSLVSFHKGKFAKGAYYNGDRLIREFQELEKLPEHKDGLKGVYKIIKKSLRYPLLAQRNNIQGRVNVSFIFEKDGSISNVKAIGRLLGGGLEEEAVRVVKNSPAWKPGFFYGIPVSVIYTLPVVFQLNN